MNQHIGGIFLALDNFLVDSSVEMLTYFEKTGEISRHRRGVSARQEGIPDHLCFTGQRDHQIKNYQHRY